jgi:hypothetical protein
MFKQANRKLFCSLLLLYLLVTQSAVIEAGADVNAASPDGEITLKFAIKFNDVETINVLREAGATD